MPTTEARFPEFDNPRDGEEILAAGAHVVINRERVESWFGPAVLSAFDRLKEQPEFATSDDPDILAEAFKTAHAVQISEMEKIAESPCDSSALQYTLGEDSTSSTR